MGRHNIEQEAKQFVKDHGNLTDSTATALRNGASRYASEQIADDLNSSMRDMSAGQKKQFIDAIAKEGQKSDHSSDWATFSQSSDGHLHVKTRAFHKYVNFGMSQDSDLNDLTQKRASLGGHGVDGGAGNSEL